MFFVEVTDAGEELAAAQLQARRQGSGIEIGLFQLDAAAGIDGEIKMRVEIRADRTGECNFGLAQVESALDCRVPMPVMPVRMGDSVDVGIVVHALAALVVVVIDPVEDHRDARVECVAGAEFAEPVGPGGGCGGALCGGLAFGAGEPGFHLFQADFVLVLQRTQTPLEFCAQAFEVGLAGGLGGEWKGT